MAKIKLANGNVALVNKQDVPLLRKYEWRHFKGRHHHTYYAIAKMKIDGEWTTVYMHRFLLGLKLGDKQIVDHRDGNGLNNRRRNFRIGNQSMNMLNQHFKTPNLSSKYIGVSWSKEKKKWKVSCQADGKNHHIGYFKDEDMAHSAYLAFKKGYFDGKETA